MKKKTLLFSALSVLSLVCLSAQAEAQEEDAVRTTLGIKPKRYFLGISGGSAYATVVHPELKSSRFSALTLGLNAGYLLSDKLSVGFELLTIEKYITRPGPQAIFSPEGTYSPLAGCDKCGPPPPGGWVAQTTAVFGAAMPSVEFAPFGRTGPYVGGAAGIGYILGLEGRVGGAGAVRAGYRYTLADTLGFAAEIGAQGELFGDAHVYAPYLSLMLRPYF